MPKLTRTTVIGIDPGKNGGIAVLNGNRAVYCQAMPDTYKDIFDLFMQLTPPPVQSMADYNRKRDVTVYMEKVHAGPKMGSSAAFKFGEGCGALRMAVVAAGLRLELISPQAWQKHHGLLVSGRGLGQKDTDKKNRNKARAQELFPDLKITHSIADALLIAEYGRQVVNRRK